MATNFEWTEEQAAELQLAANRIFANDESLRSCEFSFSIADPSIKDCPFVGCSTGFTKMTGYEMEEVLGRNCRFLVDPVPAEFVDEVARASARNYVQAVVSRLKGSPNVANLKKEHPDWVPSVTSTGGWVWCAQVNARKNGTLFRNMFHLKELDLGDKTYIIGLQAELPLNDPLETPNREMYRKACLKLDQNWIEVEKILARLFWFSAPMRRQEHEDRNDGFCSDCETEFVEHDAANDST